LLGPGPLNKQKNGRNITQNIFGLVASMNRFATDERSMRKSQYYKTILIIIVGSTCSHLKSDQHSPELPIMKDFKVHR